MVISTEKIDVLIRNGSAVICQGGDGITYIERPPARTDSPPEADIWKVVENPDYSMSVVHIGNHF